MLLECFWMHTVALGGAREKFPFIFRYFPFLGYQVRKPSVLYSMSSPFKAHILVLCSTVATWYFYRECQQKTILRKIL